MQQTARTITGQQLRALSLFQHLETGTAGAIAAQTRTLTLRKNELAVKRGQHLDGMYAVLEGSLKIYLLSCEGNERVIRLLQPGDCFGEAIMFNGIPSPVFVQSLSAVELCFFPKDSVYRTLAEDADFSVAMLHSLSALLNQLIEDLEAACLQNARQRIAHYLLCQAQNGHPPHNEVRLPASKAIVASTLNLSAETFSRELHQLARDGLIEIERRLIRLRQRARLHAVAQQGRQPLLGH